MKKNEYNILDISDSKLKRMKRAVNSNKSCGLSFKELIKELSK